MSIVAGYTNIELQKKMFIRSHFQIWYNAFFRWKNSSLSFLEMRSHKHFFLKFDIVATFNNTQYRFCPICRSFQIRDQKFPEKRLVFFWCFDANSASIISNFPLFHIIYSFTIQPNPNTINLRLESSVIPTASQIAVDWISSVMPSGFLFSCTKTKQSIFCIQTNTNINKNLARLISNQRPFEMA